MVNFVSLHNQTSYSILDALSDPKELMLRAKELGHPAIAITEHGSLASVWECWKLSKDIGIKLIAGCEFYFVNDAKDREGQKLRHVILLAKNAQGYKNLLTLNKEGFDNNTFDGKKVYSIIDWKLLEKYKDGLVCLTACGNGIVSALLANKIDEAKATILRLKDIFGDDLGLEIQPNNMDRPANIYNDKIDQRFINRKLINLGKEYGIRVVAACNSQYVKKEDAPVHDVLLAIGGHQPIYSNFRLKYSVPDFYLKSGQEVKDFFARNYGEHLAQEVCENSIYFSDKCEIAEWIDPKFSNPSGKELPTFPVKDEKDYEDFCKWKQSQNEIIKNQEEDKSYLRYWCEKGIAKIVEFSSEEQKKIYLDRIEEELEVFEHHGFSSYMLIVADYMRWARENKITTGHGRGSAGGSLVGYVIEIHRADPIKYDLIFARFLNKEKTAFPDIDCDFASSDRARVVNYIKNKYGADNVASISNVNTITPKVYVKDIARACELGGSKEKAVAIGNMVADMIPKEASSVEDAVAKYPLFAEACKRYPEFLKYKEICKKYRAWSTHAAGLVISSRPLIGLVPLRRDKEGLVCLEYEKNHTEENGLIKMDLLGISTLDTIDLTKRLIKKTGKDIGDIDAEAKDEKTYNLISTGKTFGVFQLGTSAGTMDLCKRVKPTELIDLANINALARPSAKDIRTPYVKVKEGKDKVVLLHPNLGRAFNSTLGFGLYEECLMYLAQDIAGWTLHSADRLRKMTKDKGKNPEKIKQLRQEFIDCSVNNNISITIATRIWDEVIELFQGYGFNKPHAIFYGMLGFETAYLKAHYPIEFLLANLMEETGSNALNAKSKIDKIKNEIRENKVKIFPPDVNKSDMQYTLDGKNLLTGLEALKSVGTEAIKDIIEKRPFKSFFDFMVRVNSSKVRANNIQALAASGAMDNFGLTRKQIFYYCSDYRKKLQIWLKKHNPESEEFVYPFPEKDEWTVAEKYALEMQFLNEAFACLPYKAYQDFFLDSHDTLRNLKESDNKKFKNNLKVIVKDMFEFKVKKETSKMYGKTMAKLLIEDKFGTQCSCTVFPDRWEALQDHISTYNKKMKFEVGTALHISGSINVYEEEIGIIMDKVYKVQSKPLVPTDLKPKKINLLEAKKKSNKLDIYESKENDVKDLQEELEDNLIEQGLLDFTQED